MATPLVLDQQPPWEKWIMQFEKWRGFSIARPFAPPKAALLLGVLLLAMTTPAWAGGCFPDVYYNFMFKPVAQEVLGGGDSRLQGMSDYLAAKGEDPHGEHGSGCMCGVNNGRWDQVLVNSSQSDAARAPVSFQVLDLKASLFKRNGKPVGARFELNRAQLAHCLDGSMKVDGWRPYTGGQVKDALLLEPGENALGCICLKAKDRHLSGFVKLSVAYAPVIMASPLPGPGAALKVDGNELVITGSHAVKIKVAGGARYFKLAVPVLDGWQPAALEIKLTESKCLSIRTSPNWQGQTAQWAPGGLTLSGPQAAAGALVMVRSTSLEGRGKLSLTIIYESASGRPPAPQWQAPAAGPRAMPVGPPAFRTFKSHVLGMGSPKANPRDGGVQRPCCCGS
jgi:hypothetical protein